MSPLGHPQLRYPVLDYLSTARFGEFVVHNVYNKLNVYNVPEGRGYSSTGQTGKFFTSQFIKRPLRESAGFIT